MSKIRTQKAFSMVEMMLLLVIASLIVAASVPIITKKHLHLPSSANHGSYICYYKDNQLMEARKSGKRDQKMLAGYPRPTTNCVFEPPAKATMFQITAIGGGGGGGDAGYNGSIPQTYNNGNMDLSPFGPSRSGLTRNDILSIGVKDTDDAVNEVIGYMGHLWAFAQGAHSGLAGDIDYTTISTGTEEHDCPVNKIKTKQVARTKTVGTTTTLCSGADEGSTTVTATVYACYKKKSDGTKEKVGSYATYNGASATCKDTWMEDSYECISPGTTHKETVKYLKEVIEHPAEYRTTGTYTVTSTVTTTIPGQKIDCSNPCQYLGQVNCNPGPCFAPDTTKTETITEDKPCGNGVAACLIKAAEPTEYIYDYKEVDVADPCVNTYKQVEKEKTWTESAPSDITNGTIDGEGVTCEKDTSASFDGTTELTYYETVADGCEISTSTNKVTYSKSTHTTPSTRNIRGLAPFCTTSSISGGLGLSYSTYSDIPGKYASDGSDVNSDISVASPHSFCDDLGSCGPSVGLHYNTTYSQAIIGAVSTISRSAPTGATGDSLTQKSVDIDVFSYADADGIYTKKQTFYYDEVNEDGFAGTDGACVTNDPAYVNKKPDCRGGIDVRTGYCLQRFGKAENEAVLNGYYRYRDTYDTNYLHQGLPGEPGEYKTVVVRSLNNINRTISIGSGGSGAAVNLGGKGADGSATIFGNILIAEGGKGGEGSQKVEISEHLPAYDGTNFDYTKVQKCLTTNELDDDATCQGWKNGTITIPFYQNTSGDVGSKPTVKAIGGMFSFVLKAFGISNDDTVDALLEFSGRGGRGGGVEHFCWAGQYILTFEDHTLLKSSVFWENRIPAGINAASIPDSQKIPVGCATAFRNIPAGPGFDGALIITW